MTLMRRVLIGDRRTRRCSHRSRRRRLVHGALGPRDALQVSEENQRGGKNAPATAEQPHEGNLTPGDPLDPAGDEG